MTVASLATTTHSRPAHPADAGDDAGARDGVVVAVDAVHPEGGQRAELEERAARVEQPVDPVADQQLAAVGVLARARLTAAPPYDGQPLAQLVDQAPQVGGGQLSHQPRLAIINLTRQRVAHGAGHSWAVGERVVRDTLPCQDTKVGPGR